MPIRFDEYESTTMRWAPTITATADGLTIVVPFAALTGSSRGYDEYEVPAFEVPCSAPGFYRLSLIRTADSVALHLINQIEPLDGEVLRFARWTLAEGQTCADVEIEVTRRVLVARPPTVMDVPVYEDQVDEETGEIRQVQVGTEQVVVPPEPLPDPTRHAVSPVLVLPRAKTFEERTRELDQLTVARIAAGFEHNGKRFSLSDRAQQRANGVRAGIEDETFPMRWNTIDDRDSITFENAAEFLAFWRAGRAALRAALDANTTAKDPIRAEAGS